MPNCEHCCCQECAKNFFTLVIANRVIIIAFLILPDLFTQCSGNYILKFTKKIVTPNSPFFCRLWPTRTSARQFALFAGRCLNFYCKPQFWWYWGRLSVSSSSASSSSSLWRWYREPTNLANDDDAALVYYAKLDILLKPIIDQVNWTWSSTSSWSWSSTLPWSWSWSLWTRIGVLCVSTHFCQSWPFCVDQDTHDLFQRKLRDRTLMKVNSKIMIIAHLNIFPKLIYHAAIIKQVLEFQFYMIVDHLKICSGPKLQVVLQMPFWFPRRPKEQKVGMYTSLYTPSSS